jgi:hypothetical protein
MPAGGDCCQKVTQTSDMSAILKAPAFHPIVVVSLYIATWEMPPSTLFVTGGIAHPDTSPPPESPPATISIFRV